MVLLAMIFGLCWKLGIIPPTWLAGFAHVLTKVTKAGTL